MPEANPLEGLQLDELQVVSDLHLGGLTGFQIFASGAELAWLADSVRLSPAKGLAALCGQDTAARARLQLVTDGTGVLVTVGRARGPGPCAVPAWQRDRRLERHRP